MKSVIYICGYLSIEVIQACTLNCEHCMKGTSTGKKITKEVLEKIFDKIKYVNTLCLTGGDITLALNEIELILQVIKEKKTIVDNYQIVINGVNYNQKLFKILKDNFESGEIYISSDYFHDKSILEKYGNNLDVIYKNWISIINEEHFKGFKHLPKKLFDCGNAKNINSYPKVKTNSMGHYTYSRIRNINNIDLNELMVGPTVSFDVSGNLTNGNCTYKINNYNYLGNIFDDDIFKLFIDKSISTSFKNQKEFLDVITKRIADYSNDPNAENYVIRNKKYTFEERKIVCENIDYEIKNNESLMKKLIK